MWYGTGAWPTGWTRVFTHHNANFRKFVVDGNLLRHLACPHHPPVSDFEHSIVSID
jgi:hypothetical protein